MQEISLNILDIAQNSIKANASVIYITIAYSADKSLLTCSVSDNGCGMTKQQAENVTDPFYTTRTTRKVGLGVPFFKMTAEMTGGSFKINSKVGEGTDVCAVYHTDHIDMLPLGDMTETVISLICVNPNVDFVYVSKIGEKSFTMDTREFKQVLNGVDINSLEVLTFIRDYINENQQSIEND